MTHTPGPWLTLFDNAGGGRNIGIEHKGRFIGIAHTGAVRAPNVLHGREPIEEDEAKANATLIAGAPDLLAQAVFSNEEIGKHMAAIEAGEYEPSLIVEILCDIQNQARAAITKATTPTDSNTKEEST